MVKEIQIRNSGSVLVSDVDYEWLTQWEWRVYESAKSSGAYAVRAGSPHNVLMHRVIVSRYQEIPDGMFVDHINGNKLDNRRENLRVVTRGENMRNQSGRTVCGFKGVTWNNHRKKWATRVGSKTTKTHLSPVIAAVFANDLLRERDGEFARLNDIPPHIEKEARQAPYQTGKRPSAQQLLAQLEHAERVERAYSEWLIMKRITDWLAEAPPTASANAVANAA